VQTGSVDLSSYSTKIYVDDAVSTVKSDILGGIGHAYDTLQELKSYIDASDSNMSSALAITIGEKAVNSEVVHLAGAETITGIKDFSNGFSVSGGTITLPTNSIATSAINNNYLQYLDATSSIQLQLNDKATDTSVVHLSQDETITGTKTFNNYQVVERMAEQVYNAGSGTSLSLSYTSIKGIIYYSPSANYTLTLSNVPTTSTTMIYTLTLIYNTKFYANAININGTAYTMRAGGGLANITVDENAVNVIQQINIMFLNSSTPIVITNILSLF